MIHYLNGKWLKDDELKISIFDIAVLRGFGIFDFLRTYGTNPFRLGDHIDRFYNSAKLMGMKPVLSKKEISVVVHEGIKKNKFKNTQIKFVQTGGVSPDGFMPSGKPSFFILFYEAKPYPSIMYTKGIKLLTSSIMRQVPTAKTINYMASIAEVQKAHKVGAVDILHTDQTGKIYEATRSNFYAIKNGQLITAEEGVLLGITRIVILEIAKKLKIKVVLRSLNKSELNQIDEAFITNSSQEIAPVVRIDKQIIGNGKVGSRTKSLMAEFRKVARE